MTFLSTDNQQGKPLALRVTQKHNTETTLNQPPRILVVEDDSTSREFLRRALEKSGCEVTTADCVVAAQKAFTGRDMHWFDSVLTDYQMPGRNGLELLAWIKEKDPCLKGIILTAEGEKSLVADSLRAGASDFLDKPVNLQRLLPALTKAVGATRHLRHLAETELAVQSLGRTQKQMINAQAIPIAGGGTAIVDVCFHPKLEAGGDFFSHFQPSSEILCCLLTDVSGHDLQAAYVSAYFQGIVRGMLQCGAPMPAIFSFFNRFLVSDWNQGGQSSLQKPQAGVSVAALSLLFNFKLNTIEVVTCGTPGPVHIAADGRAGFIGETGGAPLGWFGDWKSEGTTHSIAGGGSILLWTDGLQELAEGMDLHPLCVAHRLEQARLSGARLPLLDTAKDDILFASLRLPNNPAVSGHYSPFLLDEYHGGQDGEIDQFVERWRQHLQFTIPKLSEPLLHDILLAAREAVINAIRHGCGGDATKQVRFQMSFHPEKRAIKIWIEDPGPGHQFDFDAHEQAAADQILSEHRGLIFMVNLAHGVNFQRNGASVILEFNVSDPS